MRFWHENVDNIIKFNKKALLTDKGKVSNAQMEKFVEQVYEQFHQKRKTFELEQADLADIQELKMLEKEMKNIAIIISLFVVFASVRQHNGH